MTLYILSGCPASGKSTFGKKMSKITGIPIVSRDEIRFSLLKDDEDYFSHEEDVFTLFIRAIKENLLNVGYCIADATHITTAARMKLIHSLGISKNNLVIEVISMKTPLTTCIARNDKRTGREKVPYNTLCSMYRKSQEFDSVEILRYYDGMFIVTEDGETIYKEVKYSKLIPVQITDFPDRI